MPSNQTSPIGADAEVAQVTAAAESLVALWDQATRRDDFAVVLARMSAPGRAALLQGLGEFAAIGA